MKAVAFGIDALDLVIYGLIFFAPIVALCVWLIYKVSNGNSPKGKRR
jgi:hypothetical protein